MLILGEKKIKLENFGKIIEIRIIHRSERRKLFLFRGKNGLRKFKVI